MQGSNVNKMIHDLQELVIELKKKNTRITLITLIPSPKLPRSRKLDMRMDTFNKAVMDYAYCKWIHYFSHDNVLCIIIPKVHEITKVRTKYRTFQENSKISRLLRSQFKFIWYWNVLMKMSYQLVDASFQCTLTQMYSLSKLHII